jgi:hypothetical protein
MGSDDVDCIHSAEDRNYSWPVTNTVNNFKVSYTVEKFLVDE